VSKRTLRLYRKLGTDLDDKHIRQIAGLFGVPLRMIGFRERRDGHRHRGTAAWAHRRGKWSSNR